MANDPGMRALDAVQDAPSGEIISDIAGLFRFPCRIRLLLAPRIRQRPRHIGRRPSSRPSREWRMPAMKTPTWQPQQWSGSFAEHDLDAEPHRSDKAGDDNGNDGLECIALRLFDALAPAPQMLKVRPQFRERSSHLQSAFRGSRARRIRRALCRHGPSSDRQAAAPSEMQSWKIPFPCARDAAEGRIE